jgi:hypothetical protein
MMSSVDPIGSIYRQTKAETLDYLRPLVRQAQILPQVTLTLEEWESDPDRVFLRLQKMNWIDTSLIVRSSAQDEDQVRRSMAGHYISIPHVLGKQAIEHAINRVFNSYQNPPEAASQAKSQADRLHQVLIQPMLVDLAVCGVAFSQDPNTGSPYIVISYDSRVESTDKVTSGTSNEIRTFYYLKGSQVALPSLLKPIIDLIKELEGYNLLGSKEEQALDIEFAIDKENQVFLLQVRPLSISQQYPMHNLSDQKQALSYAYQKIQLMMARNPFLYGEKTILGVMPDWNPAEMIGIRPRPLARSLYKELITDSTWAYQRNNYGYKNMRSFPLLIDLCGVPYICVKTSFNSFLPANLDPGLSERLVNYYIEQLIRSPSYHDKVEFEIVLSCYTFDLLNRLKTLKKDGFSSEDCVHLEDSLRALTNRIIHGKTGLWKSDTAKADLLLSRRNQLISADLDIISKIYWMIEDCKRYGTLPFAGLARAGFIAVQILKSLVKTEVLTQNDYEGFMGSLNTVSSRMIHDQRTMNREEFLNIYGHLRPGSYDILSLRYDEDPDRYFKNYKCPASSYGRTSHFALSLQQLNQVDKLIKQHGIESDTLDLFNFIQAAIEGREYSKFIFTKNLSDVLSLFRQFAQSYGFSVEDSSFASIDCIKKLYSSSESPERVLARSIQDGKERHRTTQLTQLPALITSPEEVWAFHHVACTSSLEGRILMLPSADPGYDWIFSHSIAGFITMYGGVNSHMAIRAGEMGVPAVIGAGESYYSSWSKARYLEIDCANRKVNKLA